MDNLNEMIIVAVLSQIEINPNLLKHFTILELEMRSIVLT